MSGGMPPSGRAGLSNFTFRQWAFVTRPAAGAAYSAKTYSQKCEEKRNKQNLHKKLIENFSIKVVNNIEYENIDS